MSEFYTKKQILHMASSELEAMRGNKILNSSSNTTSSLEHKRFPKACLKLLYSIPGNQCCMDCGARNPQWAALSFGSLLCIDCSGSHRHLGVNVSVVRSVIMDSWSHSDILAMLEGGNQQLDGFFSRHSLTPSPELSFGENNAIVLNRYKTNAAKFYRNNLSSHVSKIMKKGIYVGREAYRNKKSKKSKD